MTPEQIAQSIKNILVSAFFVGYSYDIDPYLSMYQESEDLRVETYNSANLPDKTYRVTVTVEEIA